MDQRQARPLHFQRQPWELYALVGTLIAQTALVIVGNLPSVSLWLLLLLALGLGQALLLPTAAGLLGGLLVVVLWVLLRRATGILVAAELLQSGLEVGGFALNLLLAVGYARVWRRQQNELTELRSLQSVFVGEAGTGLFPFEVAELRMREEVDRARAFHRPLGLLLVENDPKPGGEVGREKEAYRLIARQLTVAALVHDIPFRIDANRFGLLLPEMGWEDIYAHADEIVKLLENISLPDLRGESAAKPLPLNLHFGLGVYNGEYKGEIDLLRAAEDSLDINRDLAEFKTRSVSTYAMPAAPVIEVLSNPSKGP